MADNFKFEDKSKEVKGHLRKTNETAMLSVLLMIEAQAKGLARVDTGEMRDKIDHKIKANGSNVTGQVGSPNEHAIYNEYGTGEFAENGAGRKGGWVYKAPDGHFYFTYGMKPRPFLRPAFRNNKQRIKDTLGNKYKTSFKGK